MRTVPRSLLCLASPVAPMPDVAPPLLRSRTSAPARSAGAAPAAAPPVDAGALLAAPSPTRLVSLDAFRGATIVGMILVNNPGTWGAIFGPLKHADWHGWTPTDLVFPFFLFIVGVSIALAYARPLAENRPRGPLAAKATRRALWLFALGVGMAAFPFFVFPDGALAPRDYGMLRIMGVLQRIAVCYLAAVGLYLYAPRRVVWTALWTILVGYTVLLLAIPVPGVGRPEIDFAGSTWAAWLDRQILTPAHLYAGSSPPRTSDPEGLVSTLPAIASTLFGLWAGLRLLRDDLTGEQKVLHLLLAGVALVALGYLWSWALPLNKPLWTSSYAVFTAGQALCGLGVFYWLFDLRGKGRWAHPLVVYGVNAITVFVLSGLVAKTLGAIHVAPDLPLQKAIFETVFKPLGPIKVASLLYALTWIGLWYAILAAMYRRRWIVKV